MQYPHFQMWGAAFQLYLFLFNCGSFSGCSLAVSFTHGDNTSQSAN
jgi:hypothetical protein